MASCRILAAHLLVATLGCSVPVGDRSGETSSDGGGDAGPVDKLSWTYVYATYFGPNTPGHCGQSGCHGATREGFLCSSQATCYDGLTAMNTNVGGRMVDPSAPPRSLLLDPKSSPLIWFGPDGNMPRGALSPNDTAKAEITAWVAAGAPND